MARRVLLLIGIIAVVMLVAILVMLAMSGSDQEMPVNSLDGPLFKATLEPLYDQTLTALALIDSATETAAYSATTWASTQQAAVYETGTAAANTVQAATAASAVLAQTAAANHLTQTSIASKMGILAGTLHDPQGEPLPGVGLRLYRDDGDRHFAPFTQDPLLQMIPTGADGEYDFGLLDRGGYWLEVAYYSLPEMLRASIAPDAALFVYIEVKGPDDRPVVFAVGPASPTPTWTRG